MWFNFLSTEKKRRYYFQIVVMYKLWYKSVIFSAINVIIKLIIAALELDTCIMPHNLLTKSNTKKNRYNSVHL